MKAEMMELSKMSLRDAIGTDECGVAKNFVTSNALDDEKEIDIDDNH